MPSTFDPTSSPVATTSWPSPWGNEMNAVIGLSSAPSKSISTCLVSDPQMPVRRGRMMAQSGPNSFGSSMSMRSIGVLARCFTSRGASSGGAGGIGSGNSPNTRAFTSPLLLRLLFACHRDDAFEEHVDLGRLERGDVLHVGAVRLEAMAFDRLDDVRGDGLGWFEGAVVHRLLVVREVPDLGVDRPRDDEPHVHPRVPQVDRHRLAPAAQCELAGAVRGLMDDAEATAEARHVHDHSGVALEHARQDGHRHARRREEVHGHRLIDFGNGEVLDGAPFRDRGVVPDRVEMAERVPRFERDPFRGDDITEVAAPVAVAVALAPVQHFAPPVLAARHDPDGCPPFGQHRRQRGADPRRSSGDEHGGAVAYLHTPPITERRYLTRMSAFDSGCTGGTKVSCGYSQKPGQFTAGS